MNDYILLMHDDIPAHARDASERGWDDYIAKLASGGRFSGGSSIGRGICVTKDGVASSATTTVTGYLRVEAASIEDAKLFLAGNPAFEAGGTIEIRELPRN